MMSDANDEKRLKAAQTLLISIPMLNDRSIVPIVAQRLDVESEPFVRHWLAQALGRIGGEEVCTVLRKAKSRETDLFAQMGIEEALQLAGCATQE